MVAKDEQGQDQRQSGYQGWRTSQQKSIPHH